MKYIRTKDGIYDLEKSLFHFFNGCVQVVSYCKQFEENPDNCKATNTIEELCDEFVVVANYGIGYGANPNIIEKEKANNFLNSFGEWSVYGAIWTEKGLLYIAKMNDKGELEWI